LGDNSTMQRLAPVDVQGLTSGVSAIEAGTGHTCAITTAGSLKCWGSNEYGQLGDNSTVNRLTPTSIPGLTSGVTAIEAENHSCAAASGGRVKCWGYNSFGQLGDGSVGYRTVPSGSVLTSGVGVILNTTVRTLFDRDTYLYFEVVVSNFGSDSAIQVATDWSFSPAVPAPDWTCTSTDEVLAPCPASSGTGFSSGAGTLVGSQSWHFIVPIVPADGTVFQDMTTSSTASNTAGSQGSIIVPLSVEAIFKDGFE
jgi:hypothetical protein